MHLLMRMGSNFSRRARTTGLRTVLLSLERPMSARQYHLQNRIPGTVNPTDKTTHRGKPMDRLAQVAATALMVSLIHPDVLATHLSTTVLALPVAKRCPRSASITAGSFHPTSLPQALGVLHCGWKEMVNLGHLCRRPARSPPPNLVRQL